VRFIESILTPGSMKKISEELLQKEMEVSETMNFNCACYFNIIVNNVCLVSYEDFECWLGKKAKNGGEIYQSIICPSVFKLAYTQFNKSREIHDNMIRNKNEFGRLLTLIFVIGILWSKFLCQY
jgi:hypothetical protein